ncbi:bifunctional riboflavin kinase/FAD synthetase [Donghicola eburneus]|uniref:Riboflavin biosynthesis protein n=1 Tax=Donghicola eburneus TaxID=393278 RepID=A0A1M4MYD3_9RHOB|nr:bifunctional riboflavin kinase/FAD synthetase [Donghicola eburneus]SCM66808.1 Riboflavin biosynthesis protein RibF [Donghicola eburneus]SFQ60407.1 riboflavin kinase / FMN adenylyltransferase [Donghicola eburneus]
MRIIRDHQYIAPENKGASVAIGNFDGVHLGHQAVIDLARAGAQRLNAPLGVMTFEPHPRQFFAPDSAPFRLMSAEARAARLDKLGVEVLYELPFNGPLAGLSAEAFAHDVIKGLGLCHVVVGNDFQFGKGRSGTAADLARMGAEMGFDVTIADMIQGSQGRVSSTAIRQALADGDPRHAAEMLGHWHRIDGPVISGEQRGRDLGYPTANMSVDGLHLPKLGVYAVLVEVKEGPHKGNYHGVASLGVRPMFGENTPNLETFIFDFQGDLYGTHLSVGLVDYLRPELKFDGLEALITQMDADSAKAREILAAL